MREVVQIALKSEWTHRRNEQRKIRTSDGRNKNEIAPVTREKPVS
jgi:hypothetical protein